MASRHHIQVPVSKPFQPPTQPMPAAPATRQVAAPPPAPTLAAAPGRRLRFLPLFIVLGLLLLAGGATLVTIGMVLRKPPAARLDRDAEAALRRLKDAQRTWFDAERLDKDGSSKDLSDAFSHLMAVQRTWWDSEGLAQNGNSDPAEPLAKLEELERSWWTKEGLADGKKISDAEATLNRLADINQEWWTGERLTRAANAPADEEGTSGEAPAGSDSEYKLITDKSGTQKFLASGGTEESEQAVQVGLKWLAAQQLPDGRWTANGSENGKPRGRGGNDVASTSLALLPFLAHGETHRGAEGRSLYSKRIDAGLKFLLSQMKSDGDLRGGHNMYVHALATMALCQAFDTSGDPLLREPCQKAIDFLVKAQDPRGGGFRYAPGQAGDMSVTSWCLMALKSGQMAGLHIPATTIDKAKNFLERVSRADGGYNYVANQPGHSPPTPAVMTAAGIVCRQYLSKTGGDSRDLRSSDMLRGVDIILKHPPNERVRNFYYYYYATYALLGVGGDAWKEWNPKCRDLLIRWQDKGDKNPALKGSWDPQGAYQLQQSGRVGVTALALLTLEVYYRNLPVNRPELGEMAKPTSKK
jgi:hypothetical protein